MSAHPPPPPAVDVGIPAYGKPDYLVHAIESVLAQTYPAWRLTIRDDAPPDSRTAPEVVARFLADSRIRYAATAGRTGEVANTNGLIAEGTAPYVVILHDDDRLHPEYLERRVSFMEAHPECGFCFSGFDVTDATGAILRSWVPPLEPGVIESDSFARILLDRNVVGPPPAALVRRSAYENVGTLDASIPHGDWELWLRLALEAPVGFLGGVDSDHRVHVRSTSHSYRRPARHTEAFARRLTELVEKKRPWPLRAMKPRRVRAHLILEEIGFDLGRRGGDRSYATRLLLLGLSTDPRAVVEPGVRSWLKIMAGRRVVGLLGRQRRRWLRADDPSS